MESKICAFDSLAWAYDAWFEEDGKLIFASEVEALRKALPLLPKPWVEVGVGSGRFAQALGIDIGLDPSIKFQDGVFGAAFLVVTLCFVDSPMKTLGEAARLLKREGKVVLGLVLKESPWGQFYQRKKETGHRFYRYATFYSYAEVDMLLMQTGFSVERVISTLFQKPGEVNHIELPRQSFSADAGFTVILAGKTTA